MPKLDSFATSDLAQLPPIVVETIEAAPISDLDQGPQVPELFNLLNDGLETEMSSLAPLKRSLCISGLWLLAGELNEGSLPGLGHHQLHKAKHRVAGCLRVHPGVIAGNDARLFQFAHSFGYCRR